MCPAARAPSVGRMNHDSSAGVQSTYTVLGRVTGAAGVATLLAVVGTSIVNGYQNHR